MVGHSGQAVEISARSKKRSLQVARMVAAAVVNALTIPPESTVEEMVILPSAGVL